MTLSITSRRPRGHRHPGHHDGPQVPAKTADEVLERGALRWFHLVVPPAKKARPAWTGACR